MKINIIFQDEKFSIEELEGEFKTYTLPSKELVSVCWDSTTAIQFVISHYIPLQYNIDSLPNGAIYSPPERIICAANKYENHLSDKVVIAGVRHACPVMSSSYCGHNSGEDILYQSTEIQGFLTNKHRFVDRQEAWKIAVEQKQIVRRVGGDTAKGGTLYSENLY